MVDRAGARLYACEVATRRPLRVRVCVCGCGLFNVCLFGCVCVCDCEFERYFFIFDFWGVERFFSVGFLKLISKLYSPLICVLFLTKRGFSF